mmetsp:Transcript_850/g.1941  ORF Transcript_850/g.1941 Transcript_850/m.1941 type:complete len:167 (+) Transcript_850:54-554(+)
MGAKAEVTLREACDEDVDKIYQIFLDVTKTGDSMVYEADLSRENAMEHWYNGKYRTYVAEINGEVAGTFILRPNQPGLGSHIANCAYMVSPKSFGNGVGRAMGQHSIAEAKRLGYRAVQFNIVVSTNTAAVNLWKSLGFEIVGTVPEAYNHQQHGLVDIYVMYRKV